ncbi:MAG: nucleotidyltransferase family protein [Candidatus Bipolaricaulia bacterium]
MDKSDILNVLRENTDHLRENYGVSRIGLFGSFELETNEENSDVDLLVDFKKGHKDLFNFIRLKNYLEDLLEREVDLVTEKALKDRLKDKILDQVEYVE